MQNNVYRIEKEIKASGILQSLVSLVHSSFIKQYLQYLAVSTTSLLGQMFQSPSN